MPIDLETPQFPFGAMEADASREMQSKCQEPQLDDDYFRLRDFEFAQPLYDLAYFLEADAIAKDQEIPKYRTFSLWRAAYSFDGYSTTLDKWLDKRIGDDDLDYVPSNRIRSYLLAIRQSGTIPELQNFASTEYERLRRLRAVKGLGFSQLAKSLGEGDVPSEQWVTAAVSSTRLSEDAILSVYHGAFGTWQSAHIVPPLVRLLREFETGPIANQVCSIDGGIDGISTITHPFFVEISGVSSRERVNIVLAAQPAFTLKTQDADAFLIRHQLGWYFRLQFGGLKTDFDLANWAITTDPFLQKRNTFKADLHLHTAWSDGNASLESMAVAIKNSGLTYFAVTDHSRS
jgi:hypothetical protein